MIFTCFAGPPYPTLPYFPLLYPCNSFPLPSPTSLHVTHPIPSFPPPITKPNTRKMHPERMGLKGGAERIARASSWGGFSKPDSSQVPYITCRGRRVGTSNNASS